MPTAKYFRLKAFKNKDLFEITSLQLFNDNTRVDQNGTISTPLETDTVKIGILKSDVPDSTKVFSVNVKNLHETTLYFLWTFATAVNVNSFRIGSGSSEDTFLNQFVLEYSLDGISFKTIVPINKDKKLAFPGSYTLSSLKNVGEIFPFLFSKNGFLNMATTNSISSSTIFSIGQDQRSIKGINPLMKKTDPLFRDNSIYTTFINNAEFFTEIPGYFSNNKFYFEITVEYLKTEYTSSFAFLISPEQEGLRYPSNFVSLQGVLINNFGTHTSANAGPLTIANSNIVKTENYTIGLAVDLASKTIAYTQTDALNIVPQLSSAFNNSFSNFLGTNTKFKFYISFRSYYLSLTGIPGMSFNFGQSPFKFPVPNGFTPGVGPRWEEVIADNSQRTFSNVFRKNHVESYSFEIPDKTTYVDLKPITVKGNEWYFIKGYITRVPDSPNKRFKAILIDNFSQTRLGVCDVGSSGMYEFYGIPNNSYTVLSIDVLNNTVAETIGPVYPKKVI